MAEVKKDMGFGVDKPDTRGDVERFKGHHRKSNLYRIHTTLDALSLNGPP